MAQDYGSEQVKAEFEVLEAIYGQELTFLGHNKLKIPIRIAPEPLEPLVLTITVGEDYPQSTPSYSFGPLQHGRWFTTERERKVVAHLKSLFDPQDSDNIMKAIEWVRESAYAELNLSENDLELSTTGKTKSSTNTNSAVDALPLPTIYHSHKLTDRKSKFQAHFARCWTEEEVQAVLRQIQEDPKCGQATHPCIYAWRLSGSAQTGTKEDSSDDGEGGAAAYLENLMQTRHISDGVLMVTRWFGGIQLGPDRFRHISSIAESLLNEIFAPPATAKESNAFGTYPPYSILSIAAKSIQKLKDEGTDFQLQFIGSDKSEKKTIKWNTFVSNSSQYPFHRLSAILGNNGIVYWSNYSPAHLHFKDG